MAANFTSENIQNPSNSIVKFPNYVWYFKYSLKTTYNYLHHKTGKSKISVTLFDEILNFLVYVTLD